MRIGPARRTRRPKKAPAKPRGLRIQLRGTRSRDEVRDMLRQAVDRLEELGITHASGMNFYLTPADQNGNPVTPMENGFSVKTITIEAPYKSAADEYGL